MYLHIEAFLYNFFIKGEFKLINIDDEDDIMCKKGFLEKNN